MTTFESNPPADNTNLSLAGIARRDSILRNIDAAMRRRSAIRTTRRIILASTPIILLAAFIALMLPRVPATLPRQSTPFASNQAPTLIGMVETDSTIVLRLSDTVDTSNITRLTDTELQSLLVSAGKPFGLIRAGGRTLIADELPPPHTVDSLPPSGEHGT